MGTFVSSKPPGKTDQQVKQELDSAIESWVWHAGWTDKIEAVAGSMNPVAGPYFNISTIEPTGVVGAVAPKDSALLGFVNTIAPALVTGNTVVVVTSEKYSLVALTLAEVLATSDLPLGVVSILSGKEKELGEWLAGHADINAIDLEGVVMANDLESLAASTVKRVIRPGSYNRQLGRGSIQHILDLTEVKTVWHPKGY